MYRCNTRANFRSFTRCYGRLIRYRNGGENWPKKVVGKRLTRGVNFVAVKSKFNLTIGYVARGAGKMAGKLAV